jgi:hypothetical protein
MANAFTNFLGQTLSSTTQLKDYRHAARLYVDDYFRLAPKQGFLYYVVFNINRNNNPIVQEYLNKNGRELGLLVKTSDLPKFKMSTETMNQYNRKTIVQSKIDYQAVNITFHDDHNNTTTGLWKSYYNYYFADGKNTNGLSIPKSYTDTKYKTLGTSVNESTNYGLNNKQTGPFFDSIEIYQLNRQQFTGFVLVNPIITDWTHDQMDQTQSKMLENKMTVIYETVLYGTGKVKKGSPKGFAELHYDNEQGPLSIFGGGNNSILGAGGIVPGIGEIFGGSGDTSIFGLVRTARGATNLVKNAKNVTRASVLSEGFGLLDKVARTGKLPDVLSGTSPAGLSLATLPGEQPTTAVPRSEGAGGGGFNLGATLGNVAAGFTAGITTIGNTLKGLLPASLPSTSVGLTAVQDEQRVIASTLQSQIQANQLVQEQFAESIAVAQATNDAETLDTIYNQLDAVGYTDPVKLTEQLNSVNQNIADLNVMIAESVAVEVPNATLNVDAVDLGVSEEDSYNVTNNPDLVTQTNINYNSNITVTQQYY